MHLLIAGVDSEAELFSRSSLMFIAYLDYC